uniref:(northern house mosquito) hypothetical protein n=1 Tax=Culex pipiens TaxID=7175 RepID=A0A8D8AY96_CULPI
MAAKSTRAKSELQSPQPYSVVSRRHHEKAANFPHLEQFHRGSVRSFAPVESQRSGPFRELHRRSHGTPPGQHAVLAVLPQSEGQSAGLPSEAPTGECSISEPEHVQREIRSGR